MTEYFDVVDRQDQPTGELTTKTEAHEKSIPHRVVAVFVFHPDGRLYVQVHKKSGGLLDHTVGGHVSSGEDYLTAAKREMLEEIGLEAGLELVASSVLEDCPANDRGNNVHLFGVYKTTAPDGWEFQPNDEVEELRLMSMDDLIERMKTDSKAFTFGFVTTMQAYQQAIENE